MPPTPDPILRRVEASDDAFMRALFLASRPELEVLCGLGPAGEQLADLQLHAQRVEYAGRYPDACDEVITLGDTPVGRCWTSESEHELHVLDLMVLPEFRRRGLARAVMQGLVRRASSRSLTVRLTVWHENAPARRLYTALGLRETDEAGGYVAMERCPDETGVSS